MPRYCFKQPNGNYGVWSTITDSLVLLDATKEDVCHIYNVNSEDQWQRWVKPDIESAVETGDIACSILNGQMSKEMLLEFFEIMGYTGKLYEYTKNFKQEELDQLQTNKK